MIWPFTEFCILAGPEEVGEHPTRRERSDFWLETNPKEDEQLK
jgi:hypothetical protein